MNRCILTLIFILISFAAGAQYSYVPMPLETGQWRYRMSCLYYGKNPLVNDYMYIGSNADTLISGKTYKKIFTRSYRHPSGTPLNVPVQSVVAGGPDMSYDFIREANQKVYWYRPPFNGYPEQDTLIYDFTRNIGDTLPTVFSMYPGYNDFLYIIQAIDTITVNGTLRKRFKANNFYHPQDVITVIEGVGSNRGLIMNNKSGSYGVYDFTLEFHCYTEPGYEYNPDNKPCAYVWPGNTPVSVHDTKPHTVVTISPNPFCSNVTITTPTTGNVIIYTPEGRTMHTQSISIGNTQLDASSWSPGPYFLRFTSNDGNTLYNTTLHKQY